MDDLSRYEAIHQIGLPMIFLWGDLYTQLRSCMFVLLHIQCSHCAPSLCNIFQFFYLTNKFFRSIMFGTNVSCQGLTPKKAGVFAGMLKLHRGISLPGEKSTQSSSIVCTAFRLCASIRCVFCFHVWAKIAGHFHDLAGHQVKTLDCPAKNGTISRWDNRRV